jgi:hypothetical protein
LDLRKIDTRIGRAGRQRVAIGEIGTIDDVHVADLVAGETVGPPETGRMLLFEDEQSAGRTQQVAIVLALLAAVVAAGEQEQESDERCAMSDERTYP